MHAERIKQIKERLRRARGDANSKAQRHIIELDVPWMMEQIQEQAKEIDLLSRKLKEASYKIVGRG